MWTLSSSIRWNTVPRRWELELVGPMHHPVESNDTLLMPARNEPSIAPLVCRDLRQSILPFPNLIQRTIVFLTYTACPDAIANFIALRIIGMAAMSRTQKTRLSIAALCLTKRNQVAVARLEASLTRSTERSLCVDSSSFFTASAKVSSSCPTRGWIA
jgi:hypothetical protein